MTEKIIQKLRTTNTKSSTFWVEDIYKIMELQKTKNLPTLRTVTRILRVYFSEVVKYIVEGRVFYFPSGLGHIRAVKLKTGIEVDEDYNIKSRLFYTNFKKTEELGTGQIIYNTDLEYLVKMKWYKGYVKSRNLFYFVPSRELKRQLYELAKTNSLMVLNRFRDGIRRIHKFTLDTGTSGQG